MFYDDIMPKDYARRLSNEILDRNVKIKWQTPQRVNLVNDELLQLMAKAGCHILRFGVEQGDPEMMQFVEKKTNLKLVKKAFNGAKKAGIDTFAYFIIGYIFETPKTMQKTIDLALELDPRYVMFTKAVPLPSTPLMLQAVKEGLIDEDYWKKYTLELEYEFDVKNISPTYDDGMVDGYLYNGEYFECNEDYSTEGKGTDLYLYVVTKNGPESIDLEEIIKALSEEGEDEEEVEEQEEPEEDPAAELEEYKQTVQYLRGKLQEVNLLNAKLLYTNKLFRSRNISETQKMKVIEQFDRAANVREVKLVYTTFAESMKRKPVNESASRKGQASKPMRSTKSRKPIIGEQVNFKTRMKKLANII